MIEPTRAYDGLPGLSSDEAADWMITAARTRPVRIAPRMAVTAHALNSVAPSAVDAIMKRQRVHARQRPDAVALVVGERTITFADLDARSNQAAQAFRAAGIGFGDRVAF